ncbi:hypothetical protein BLOT_015653 [Blomia tropicalis]|nr:hypothetical protein BLOT_015653 [Blomia tropicalis]
MNHIIRSISEPIIVEAKEKFEQSGFIMHKLFTNSSLLSEDLSIMEDCKLLGMSLYCRIDEISANLKIMDNVVTKRHLLALIGKCFVSLGRFDPVKLVLRLLVAKTRAIMDLELFKLYECAKIVARIMKYLKYHGLLQCSIQTHFGETYPTDGFFSGFNPKQYLKERIWARDMPNKVLIPKPRNNV